MQTSPTNSKPVAKVLAASNYVRMASREQMFLLQTIKGMKEKIAQDAIGTRASAFLTEALELAADHNPPTRIRLRLRNTGSYKPRQQVEAKGQICARGQARPAHWTFGLQRGTSALPHHDLRTSGTLTLTFRCRRLNMAAIDGPS